MLPTCCLILIIVPAIRADMENFIVGGTYASIQKHPHVAFMNIVGNTTDGMEPTFWTCGASILNQELLLTAAHCVRRFKSGIISIRVGHSNKKLGIARTAKAFVYHEDYISHKNYADIAIVKMSKPVVFNLRVKRVAIVKKNPPYSETARLAGWGLTNEETFAVGDRLKEVDQQVLTRMECFSALLGRQPKGTICARSKKMAGFASWGDSGSGLVVHDYILIGLVSCKSPVKGDGITIFTDINYYYDWITTQAEKLSSCTNNDS